MDLLAELTPKRQAAMFFDKKRNRANIDLLDDASRPIEGLDAVAALRAQIEHM